MTYSIISKLYEDLLNLCNENSSNLKETNIVQTCKKEIEALFFKKQGFSSGSDCNFEYVKFCCIACGVSEFLKKDLPDSIVAAFILNNKNDIVSRYFNKIINKKYNEKI
jgi:hypothetical protein